MELNIIRREQAGTGQQQYNESETLVKYELMDGAPVRGWCRVQVQTADVGEDAKSGNTL